MASLTRLNLSDCKVANITPLRACTALSKLSLSGCRRLSDQSMVTVANAATSLTTINLDYCKLITDRTVDALARPIVRELRLESTQITDAALEMLAARATDSLENLVVGTCKVGDQGTSAPRRPAL